MGFINGLGITMLVEGPLGLIIKKNILQKDIKWTNVQRSVTKCVTYLAAMSRQQEKSDIFSHETVKYCTAWNLNK